MSRLNILAVLNGIPHGVVLLDTELRVLWCNRLLTALTGYAGEAVCGLHGDYVLRSNIFQQGNPLAAVLENGETISVDGDIINQGRKKVPIRFTISPLSDMDGDRVGLLLTLEDISLLQDLDKKRRGAIDIDGIIGHSPEMHQVFDLLPVIAQTDASALITGETGTGKDLIAEAIHNSSKRVSHPFIKVNCGALPESLLESELFGHVRGAFTGAAADKPGMFRLAHGGTIFLTEIGDLPLPLQVKLLTVLDDREFFPLGSSKKVKVDVRVIAATHRDLREYVAQGKFREDLFYRLNVLRLHLPPLRERQGDIRILLDHFLSKFSTSLNKSIKKFDQPAMELLLRYPYPGNVRELRNIIEHAAIICQEQVIGVGHLPDFVVSFTPQPARLGPLRTDDFLPASRIVITADRNPAVGPAVNGWDEMEKKMIIDALIKTRGKRSQAAKMLGWGRSTLWRKIKEHNLT